MTSCKVHKGQLAQWFQAVVGPSRKRTDFATAEARQKICLTCHSKAGRSGRRAVSFPKQGRQAAEQLACQNKAGRQKSSSLVEADHIGQVGEGCVVMAPVEQLIRLQLC